MSELMAEESIGDAAQQLTTTELNELITEKLNKVLKMFCPGGKSDWMHLISKLRKDKQKRDLKEPYYYLEATARKGEDGLIESGKFKIVRVG